MTSWTFEPFTMWLEHKSVPIMKPQFVSRWKLRKTLSSWNIFITIITEVLWLEQTNYRDQIETSCKSRARFFSTYKYANADVIFSLARTFHFLYFKWSDFLSSLKILNFLPLTFFKEINEKSLNRIWSSRVWHKRFQIFDRDLVAKRRLENENFNAL